MTRRKQRRLPELRTPPPGIRVYTTCIGLPGLPCAPDHLLIFNQYELYEGRIHHDR